MATGSARAAERRFQLLTVLMGGGRPRVDDLARRFGVTVPVCLPGPGVSGAHGRAHRAGRRPLRGPRHLQGPADRVPAGRGPGAHGRAGLRTAEASGGRDGRPQRLGEAAGGVAGGAAGAGHRPRPDAGGGSHPGLLPPAVPGRGGRLPRRGRGAAPPPDPVPVPPRRCARRAGRPSLRDGLPGHGALPHRLLRTAPGGPDLPGESHPARRRCSAPPSSGPRTSTWSGS